jgi:hypothetical protein
MVSVAVEGKLDRMQEEHDICVSCRHLSLQTDMHCSVRFNLAHAVLVRTALNAQRDGRVIIQRRAVQYRQTNTGVS